jgi:hypothetical protein
MIRDYVERLEGEEFIKRQAEAWLEIRKFVDETVPMIVPQAGGSLNGPGSSLGCTESIRLRLPGLLNAYQIRSVLDAPCGDWTWMSQVDLTGIDYLGWDVDPEQIRRNQAAYEREGVRFLAVNILKTLLRPRVDLILCRDFLAHLPTNYISAVLDRFQRSGSRYLLASNYPGVTNEFDYHPEHFAWLGYMERPHDLSRPPFSLERINWIAEDPTPGGVNSTPHELALFRL